ncbi:sporulation membrane protein YtaF [Calorimonas adulescens]|nr:sporulation membrane protein YtaF [Calorimonas adulescens]
MVILALALSIDSLCVGLSYGMRGIAIPFVPLLAVSLISSMATFISMYIGSGLAVFLNPQAAKMLGAIILIGVGIYVLTSAIKEGQAGQKEAELLTIRLNFIEITVKVIEQPLKADLDNSGTISTVEAAFLGIALAMDAFGASLGASMEGMPLVGLPVAVGIFNMFFLHLGVYIGKGVTAAKNERLKYLPGIILILLGFITMF